MKGSQKIILGCMVVAVTNATVNSLVQGDKRGPSIKIVIGGWVLTVGLLAGSEAQPEVAEAFAVLVMMASLFGPNGDALASLVTKLVGTDRIEAVKGSSLSTGTVIGLGAVGSTARAVAVKSGVAKPDLVPIASQPNLRLDKSAAKGFAAAERAYGSTIWLSGSYRTPEQQRAGFEASPGTFADPSTVTSNHTLGLAVDVNTTKMNVTDPKLYTAFTSTGWFRKGKKIVQAGVLQPELWHYSYGVPG